MKHFLRFQMVCSKSFNYIITLPGSVAQGSPLAASPIMIQWCDRCVLKSASLCGLCFSSWSPAELSSPPAEMKINHSGKTYVLPAYPLKVLIEPQSIFMHRSMIFCSLFIHKMHWNVCYDYPNERVVKVCKVWDSLYLMAITFHLGGGY